MRYAFWAIVFAVTLASCAPEAVRFAEHAAFETGLTKRCLAFDAARSKAHARLDEIPASNLKRLHEINRAGRVICHESIDDLTAEVTGIVEALP